MRSFGMIMFVLTIGFALEARSEKQCNYFQEKSKAIQEIDLFRRWCAKATDGIGTGVDQLVKEGRQTYKRIFSKDLVNSAGRAIPPQIGPKALVQVVAGAIFDATGKRTREVPLPDLGYAIQRRQCFLWSPTLTWHNFINLKEGVQTLLLSFTQHRGIGLFC